MYYNYNGYLTKGQSITATVGTGSISNKRCAVYGLK